MSIDRPRNTSSLWSSFIGCQTLSQSRIFFKSLIIRLEFVDISSAMDSVPGLQFCNSFCDRIRCQACNSAIRFAMDSVPGLQFCNSFCDGFGARLAILQFVLRWIRWMDSVPGLQFCNSFCDEFGARPAILQFVLRWIRCQACNSAIRTTKVGERETTIRSKGETFC